MKNFIFGFITALLFMDIMSEIEDVQYEEVDAQEERAKNNQNYDGHSNWFFKRK